MDAWRLIENMTADNFLIEVLRLGKPSEITLVGAFDKSGRGSRQDVDLPLHHDGDYSRRKAEERGETWDKKIDYLCLYCLRGNKTATTLIESNGVMNEIVLKTGDAVFIDNRSVRHGRRGEVGDRILLRAWVEEVK
jgi:hypothetical protein